MEPLQTNPDLLFGRLFYIPLRFCGRKWEWIKSDSQGEISILAIRQGVGFFIPCDIAYIKTFFI